MDNLIQKSLSNIAKTVSERFGQAVSNIKGNVTAIANPATRNQWITGTFGTPTPQASMPTYKNPIVNSVMQPIQQANFNPVTLLGNNAIQGAKNFYNQGVTIGTPQQKTEIQKDYLNRIVPALVNQAPMFANIAEAPTAYSGSVKAPSIIKGTPDMVTNIQPKLSSGQIPPPPNLKTQQLFYQNMKTNEIRPIPKSLNETFWRADNAGSPSKDWHISSGEAFNNPQSLKQAGIKMGKPVTQSEIPNLVKSNTPQMMTPVVTGKARLKVKMTPVEGTPEMKAPKMNLEELNQASGLPPQGLQAQPQQKKSIISSLYDRFLNESRNKLNQMGPAGQQISKKIDNMYTEAQRQAGSKVADLTKATNQLNDAENELLIKGLRGEKSGFYEPVVKNVRAILDKVHADAKAVGLDIGYRENYAPQMVDLDKLKVNREQAIEHFINTNQMKPDNAVGFIDDVLNGTDVKEAYNRFGKPLPKKMGNLEFQRVLDWLPDVLRTDKKLLPDYIEQAYSRIAQVKHFGKNNEIGGNLLQNIQKQGYDTKLAQEILDQNLGLTRYDRTMQKASGIIRSVQAAMKLSTGAITNATQSVNTATVGGVRRTLGEIFKYADPVKRAEMNDFALRTGATLNGTMQQIMDQWKGGKTPLEKLIAPFFGNVENFNRIIAANVGRSKALAEGVIDEQALLKAGQEMVDKTQFQVRPIDLPTTWTTPMGKIATQFKSFGFRQANFVKKEILDKAVKGDIRPLARFVLAGTLINEISNNLKSFINRKDRPEDIATRIIEDIPGLGYYQDFVNAVSYGIKASSYDKNALANSIFDFVAGPTGGDIRKAISNTAQATQGNIKPLSKEIVGSIPFVGKPLVNSNPQLFGGQPKVKIQDIQNKITGKTPEVKQESGQSILDKQKIKDQISELQKQQKAIYNQSGVNIPFAGTFGAMSEEEKIKKMNELESQIIALKEQQKVANISVDMPTAPKFTGNTELDKKLISKYKGQLTTEANDAIKLFEAGKLSAVEANKIISEVKAIQTKLTPVKLKAAPKVKKVAVRKAKTSTAKFKVKAPKLTKIKITTPKKFKLSKAPKLTRVKPLAR